MMPTTTTTYQCQPQQCTNQFGHGSSWVILLATPSKIKPGGSVLGAAIMHDAQ